MKHVLRIALSVLLTLVAGQMIAQSNVQNQLRSAEQGADMIREAADEHKTAIEQLGLQFFVLGNQPNTTAYLNEVQNYHSDIEDGLDYLRYFLQQAANANAAINPDQVFDGADDIEQLRDDIDDENNVLASRINLGQTSAALQSYQAIRGWLVQIITLSDNIITEFGNFYTATATFDVKIFLVDGWGNSINPTNTGLGGFVAQNLATNQFFYPDWYGPQDEFENLPAGTYRFDSYPGYFDGTGSTQVTLSQSLVQPDGFIHVTLQYWSE